MPLTPNGKVDRRALPAPDRTKPELEESFIAPRTPIEEMLAGIWAEVLRVERVGVHDNFFELGGYSLLATQVISRVIAVVGVDLPPRTLFESPTVADMAGSVAQILAQNVGQEDIEHMLAELEAPSSEQGQRLLANEV